MERAIVVISTGEAFEFTTILSAKAIVYDLYSSGMYESLEEALKDIMISGLSISAVSEMYQDLWAQRY